MNEAFVCEATRTPIGRYGGALSSVRADDLAAHPIAALMSRCPRADWEALDDVIFGCANQAGEDNRNLARMAALLAGLPAATPGMTINRLCASGMDAVIAAARAVKCKEASLLLAGGAESMSRAPFVIGKAGRAFARDAELFDTTIGWRFVNPRLEKQYGADSMPQTAENVAAEYQVSREDQDAFAFRSQQRAAAAKAGGFFAAEISPLHIAAVKKGKPREVSEDEHPRPDTNPDTLAALPTPFRAGGTVTAGNSSGVNDGACAMLIADEVAAVKHHINPRARIVAAAASALEPRIMGVAPIAAIRAALARAKMNLRQMDWIEINEAFASQALAVLRALGVGDDAENVNPNGGAIALGHPLGMSGARLILTAAHQLQTAGGKFALCAMCVGVGQGVAVVLEKA
jgi:3-oxoadipyl-CoA thiolase